ncbi:MAG: hypothetical protein ISS16_10705 [Ignavibacteria bacterium]|nr:hypothetical protein [Ignavibacteria bacterium]
MKNHQIINILKTFSDEDFNYFRDYLRSPFFNRSKQLLNMYEVIVNFRPQFNSKNFTKKNIHNKIFPTFEYKETTVSTLLVNLSYLAQDYLMYSNVRSNYLKSQDFLFDELLKRKLYKLFEKNAAEFERILNDNRGVDVDNILSKFYFETDKYNYNVINKTFVEKQTHNENIELITNRGKHLIFYFIIQMIKQNLGLYTYKFNYDVDIENNFLIKFSKNVYFKKILEYLCNNTGDSEYSKVARTYKHLFLMFSDFENEKHYYDFKEVFLKNSRLFSYDEKQFLSSSLVQYCLAKNRVIGLDSKYNKELLEIYELIVKNEYYKFSFSDNLPVGLFRNIVILGLRLKKYKWIDDFINNNRRKLHAEQRKNMYYYCHSKIYFERGMYRKALDNFSKIQLSSSTFKVDIKNMILRTYYELNLTEYARSFIDSYRHFLRNDKTLSVERRSAYRSFVNIVQNLLDAKNSNKKSHVTYIEKRLNDKENIAFREWLYEKVSELKQEYKAVV